MFVMRTDILKYAESMIYYIGNWLLKVDMLVFLSLVIN